MVAEHACERHRADTCPSGTRRAGGRGERRKRNGRWGRDGTTFPRSLRVRKPVTPKAGVRGPLGTRIPRVHSFRQLRAHRGRGGAARVLHLTRDSISQGPAAGVFGGQARGSQRARRRTGRLRRLASALRLAPSFLLRRRLLLLPPPPPPPRPRPTWRRCCSKCWSARS